MNWTATAAGDLVMPTEVEPAKRPRSAPAPAPPEGDWLCSWCLNRVAHERDRFEYEGKGEFSFSNPEGIRFDIITFSQTIGCRETGVPTLEHTWFPGHAWSFCRCNRCGQHLGWFYTGQHDFVGLIKDRLVKGRYVWN